MQGYIGQMVFATIRAHGLWRDVNITQSIDPFCTTCKIMTISAHARGKSRDSKVYKPLDEIQIDTVPNPEPMGLSADTRFNYFLILCDRFSHIFRMCGIKDKTTDEQNGLVERHWGTIAKLANTLLLHARLNRKFFYYAAKYAQYIHDIIPVRDLLDEHGLPTTPYYLATGRKAAVKHFRVFWMPSNF